MNGLLEGKKTYFGLVAVLLGMIMKDYMEPGEFDKLIFNFLEVSGIVMAAYGRYNAKVPLSPESVATAQIAASDGLQ